MASRPASGTASTSGARRTSLGLRPRLGNDVALMALETAMSTLLSIKTHKTVSSRVPASAARRSSQYGVKVGDRITVKDTPLVCDVLKISGLPTLLCD